MKRFLASSAFLLLAGTALAQNNTTAPVAAPYFWGQKATSRIDSTGAATQFWFVLDAVPGRGYCVEAGSFEGAYGDVYTDPELTVYQNDGTTVIAGNDDALDEPTAGLLPRACWIHTLPASHIRVKLFPHSSSNPNTTITLRFTETTLFCNWFFIAGDYNAFSLIRNTGSSALAGVVVTWRGLNGVAAGTTTVAIPGNGAVILNARDFVNPGAFSNGTIEIAHSGGPNQLQGSTTTLSGTTGLGFDAAFSQRKTW